jgi:mevalonate kinase
MISVNAPGKIILFGEHAVVYGRPAIAVPVHEVLAKATISSLKEANSGSIFLEAPNILLSTWLVDLEEDQPLRKAIQHTLDALEIDDFSAFQVRVTSNIPMASGMGSSAAISVAIIRAIALHLGQNLSIEHISKIAFEVEKLHHGTPSGIDNTVVTYEKPVFFRRGEDPQIITPGESMMFLIADTGVPSQTVQVVNEVRERWISNESYYEAIFDQISELTILAKRAITSGQIPVIGPLMNQNQVLLEALGVSSPEIKKLVKSAQEAGALGVKLSGAGGGGNIISLIEPSLESAVLNALDEAGATKIILTKVAP